MSVEVRGLQPYAVVSYQPPPVYALLVTAEEVQALLFLRELVYAPRLPEAVIAQCEDLITAWQDQWIDEQVGDQPVEWP